MLTTDEKIQIIKEKIVNLEKSIADIRVPQSASNTRNQVLLFIVRQRRSIKYFKDILKDLQIKIDQV